MTGEIIILIRRRTPVPSGFSSTAKSGATQPDGDAEPDGDDHRDVEVVGPVLLPRRGCRGAAGCAGRGHGSSWSAPGGSPGSVRHIVGIACDARSPLCSLSSRRHGGRARPRGGAECPACAGPRRPSPGRSSALQVLVVVVLVVVALGLAAYDARRDARASAARPGAGGGRRRSPTPPRSATALRPAGPDAPPPAVRRAGARRHRRRLRRGDGARPASATPTPTRRRSASRSSATIGGAPRAARPSPRSTPARSGPSMRAVVPVTRRRPGGRAGLGRHHRDRDRRRAAPTTLAPIAGRRAPSVLAVGPGRRLADQPPAAAADPRPGRGARSPGCTSTTTRCCTPSARGCCCSTASGRVQLVNDEARRLLRPARRRGRPVDRTTSACRPALVAGRGRRHRRGRRDLPHRRPRAGGQRRPPATWAGPRGRRGRHPARPHRAAGGHRRARRRPRPHRVAALAEPRGRQPAAHRGVPDRDGPHRGGGRLRHRGARRSPSCSPTGWSARSTTRCWPRCCSARPPRPPSAGIELDRRPARSPADAPTSSRATWSPCVGNLVDNALDAVAGRPTRRVAVRLDGTDGRFAITVGDSGPGPHRRGRRRACSSAAGPPRPPATAAAGSASPWSPRSARRHGGEVDIGTSTVGGAEFTVTLGTGEPGGAVMTVRVLVVEDEATRRGGARGVRRPGRRASRSPASPARPRRPSATSTPTGTST